MKPVIIWGYGQLGAALASAIEASGRFKLLAVIENDPAAAARAEAEVGAGTRSGATVHGGLADYGGPAPATIFHATTSAAQAVTEQLLFALGLGHAVVSAAEWLFHPWLRFAEAAEALDVAARAGSTHVLGCGINPGFCFESLPLLLSRTVHSVRSIDILRVSDVGGVGPSDFAHLGFGLDAAAFAAQVADGTIEGHMGFPESVAALAECLSIPVDRITDELLPTFATQPLHLPYRTVFPGEVVGISQTAMGIVAGADLIRMRLEMFLDPKTYGRAPQESIEMVASRSFKLGLQPAAPPAAGAAAMMVSAAAALPAQPCGLVSLLDLPLSGGSDRVRLQAAQTRHSASGTEVLIRQPV